MIKFIFKNAVRWASLLLMWPFGALCWLEAKLCPSSEICFGTCAQFFSLLPGILGMYLRRSFYEYTLDQCAGDVFIGFGTVFSQRQSIVESQVYIGAYTLIGSSTLRARCMIGSRASVISGKYLHSQDENGEWGPTDLSQLQQIEIGENAWLGEGAIVMADVGKRAMVSAGAVVSNPVPDEIMVGGNPARFIRQLAPQNRRGSEVDENAREESATNESTTKAGSHS